MSQDTIVIQDLEVFYHVGVPDTERATPQRLLLTLELGLSFERAAASDDLNATVDYAAVCQQLLNLGRGRSWKLIETLAVEIAEGIRSRHAVDWVSVEIKKFILPETRFVGVRVRR